MPKDHLLTTDEVERVAKMFVAQGVTKIRLTGGEPTIRKDLLDVVCKSDSGLSCTDFTLEVRELNRLVRSLQRDSENCPCNPWA